MPIHALRLRLAPTLLVCLLAFVSCHRAPVDLAPKDQTYAELRAVRRGVTVTPPGEAPRTPYPRERLADGAEVVLDASGLAWLRRDGGTTLLVAGPARLTLRTTALVVEEGKLFVDSPLASAATLATDVETPKGPLHLSGVRASLTVGPGGSRVSAYVLEGEVRTESGLEASPGEELVLAGDKPTKHPVLAWDDWTGGLATTDRTAEPPPFGIGTVGARPPGARGKARAPLIIQKLDVHVTVDHDLAVTEVDETFFNPTAETVEGIYQFRIPLGATIHRFGVDREGTLVWGRVKEQAAAAQQYQKNVYAGSTEDPALLEWNAPGVYQARLYPIVPSATRRVVTRYAEWLPRQGARGERRLYVYPMAAEGSESSLPRVEEFRAVVDLAASGATDVRAGMHAVKEGKSLVVRAFDLTPRADLAVELFDDGQPTGTATAYRAKHKIEPDLLAIEDVDDAEKSAKGEADYLLVPVRPGAAADGASRGLDVAIVVDTSAATDASALALARGATRAILAHLGKDDRAAVWASDATLRPVADGSGELRPMDDARRDVIDSGLATVERGGATDLGAVLATAASKLDPARRGVVVYVGDGKPTVGELAVVDLRDRLAKLAHPVRMFALGVGEGANLGILQATAAGGFAERVVDRHGAAETALRLLEDAERPAWLGAKVDLGLGVDRIYPRENRTLFADETTLVVGRTTGAESTRVEVTADGKSDVRTLSTVWMADDGDLKRRWAEGRLAELLDEGAGRAAVVEVGTRFGVVTPYTSYYVPTANELAREVASRSPADEGSMGDPQGGTGTRAKGEEPPGNAKAASQSFGMIGLLGGAQRVSAPTRSPPAAAMEVAPAASAAAPMAAGASSPIGDAFGTGGLGLSGVGEGGGGGRGEGIGVGGIGTMGHGAGNGFGNGHGRLGGTHTTRAPSLRAAALQFLDDKDGQALVATAGKKIDAASVGVRVAAKTATVTGSLGFVPAGCSDAAAAPLDERVLLWRERIVDVRTDPWRIAGVYRDALAGCEAPTWPERVRLLYVMLDAAGTVTGQVGLWRAMFEHPTAANVLYRGLLSRVRTTAQMRELHDALGQRRLDPALLRTILDKEKTPLARVQKLRDLVAAWPDDLELALHLLDAYEDVGDVTGERAFARKLRRRDDTNAKVRTAVGEAYLRLATRAGGSREDEAEAQRTFGEIVEFAPDDPVARRRLGDLLRSHGWYEAARRQYETLAKLTPDDANVSLLLAAADDGMGKIEEAVAWAEKAEGGAAPGGDGGAATARDLASVYLAWAEDDAARGKRDKEAASLRERATRLAGADRAGGKTARVFLTWSHPEVHPTFWSNARGRTEPAMRGDALLGIASVTMPSAKEDAVVELHFEPEEAEVAGRLGAEAFITAVYDEGGDAERVVRQAVALAPGRTVRTFHVGRDGIREEAMR